MAAIHGKGGSITFTGLTPVEVTSWSADASVDMAEISAMGDSWKTYYPGLKDWTATVELIWDDGWDATDTTSLLGTTATLVLEMIDAEDNIEGTAYCTGMSVNAGIDGVVTATFNFQGSGALAWGAS
ncbi:MAG: hypothetical protein GY841_08675 [FCB group bacterium]|nr:hypothetical protein [FCB group bacterium]